MRKLRNILTIIALILSTTTAQAQDGTVEYSSEYFPTTERKIAIKGAKDNTLEELTLFLAQQGAIVQNSLFSKLFTPSIKLAHHNDIKGYNTAYSIEVKYSKVTIKYTSDEMLRRALNDFYKLFDSQGDRTFIRGCRLFFYNVDNNNKNAIARNSKGILDGVSTKKSIEKLSAAVEQVASRGNRRAVVALANKDVIRVNFECLEGVNPSIPTMASHQSYSLSDIKKLNSAAKSRGGEFIPAINLLSQNTYFEQYTGHAMTSVEGMRFVRAMIEECAEVWGVKTLCIGTSQDAELAPQHYKDFLDTVAELTSIELLIL